MTTKEIYESIDQSKISKEGKKFLMDVEEGTKGFTKQNDKVDKALLNLYKKLKEKKPEALKNLKTKTVEKSVSVPTTKAERKKEPKKETKKVTKKVVEASGTKKNTKPTKTPSTPKKGKQEHISTRASKLAKKEGITFKQARAKLSKEAKEDFKKEKKETDSELDKLLKFVRKGKFEDGEKYPKIYGKQDKGKSSVSADAKRMAKPVGKRVSKNGKTYYEYRDNRSDRNSLPAPKGQYKYKGETPPFLEAGGTLPTPFGQAGLVGETGTLNEVDLFAMGGGLPQGVHQYYANTYNPAYPTPHGYAEGGETEVRYTEDELKYALGVDDDYEDWVELAFQRGYKYDESKDEWYLPNDYAKGGRLSTSDRYVLELAGLTGLRKNAIEELVKDNSLTESELLNIIVGVGRQQIKSSVVVSAVMDGVKSKSNTDLVKFAKSEKAMRLAKGGMTTSDKHAKIIADLKKIKSDVTDRPPNVYERDGLLLVSSEEGDEFSDYYGTFYEPMYVDKRLEAIADKYDGYWVWQDAGTIGFVDDLTTISDTIGGGRNFAKGGMMQGYNDRLDESLGMRDGAERMMKQSYRDRRDESKGMEKSMGRRAYQSVGTMDKMANGGQIKERRRLQDKKAKESAKLFKVGDSVELKPEYHNLGSIRKGKVLRVYKDDGDLKVKDDNQKRVDVLFPANYFSKTSFAKGGKIGFDGLAKKVAKRYEGKPVKEKFVSEYGKTYSKAEALEVGKKVAGKVYRQQQSMAKGGKIQMSEVYNVNGKDYLFSTPIQNDKGTYTGWDAYEVVYDTFDGEKHLNYTKTKRGKSKYFPNGVKRTEAEDYFAKGGATSVDTSDVVFFAYEEMMKKNKKFKSEEELYDFVNEGYAFPKYSKKAVKTAFKSLSEDFYAKGGKTQGYNDKLDESLGNTKGKRSTKEQNYKDRRNESEAMEKKGGKRKYASVKTMDKGNRSKRKTPMSLAKEIRKEGEKWQDAVKRASAIIKKEAK